MKKQHKPINTNESMNSETGPVRQNLGGASGSKFQKKAGVE